MQEKQFIEKGAQKVKLNEFLADELEGAGYSGFDLQRTPTSTKIVVEAQRPGLVIGRGGSRIRELTSDLEEEFDFENPQIEVNEIENADGDAQVVADSIADWLEKGGHVKRVGYTYIRRMKESGVIGAEVEITGKLSGNRGRTEKFSFGYVKRCGNTSKENVQKGHQLAKTKPGAIGVKVRVMKSMPDFMHRDVDVDEEIVHESDTAEDSAEVGEKIDRIEHVLAEAEDMTSAELERALEEKAEEVRTDDISKTDIREAFEDIGEIESEDLETSEEVEEEEEDESKMDEEKAEVDSEESDEDEGDEAEYDEIVSGTISDAKDMIDDLDDPDFEALIEAEEDNKNRTTFIDWLEGKA
jgi:small subunit ribosomal protein S3